MFRMVHVNEHERGLWYRRGNFEELIMPGSTWLLSWQDRVDIIDTRLMPRFEHPMLEFLLEKTALREQLELITLQEHERAIVWIGSRFYEVLGPGKHAFWKTQKTLKVERIEMPVEWFGALPTAHVNRIDSFVNN